MHFCTTFSPHYSLWIRRGYTNVYARRMAKRWCEWGLIGFALQINAGKIAITGKQQEDGELEMPDSTDKWRHRKIYKGFGGACHAKTDHCQKVLNQKINFNWIGACPIICSLLYNTHKYEDRETIICTDAGSQWAAEPHLYPGMVTPNSYTGSAIIISWTLNSCEKGCSAQWQARISR